MASVVFFRAVNVGGHQKFQPSKLARELAVLRVVNIGAAGTFVTRENVSQASLRDEILRRLPFEPELMICPARDVLALARSEPFPAAPAAGDASRFVSVMQKAPRTLPGCRSNNPQRQMEVRIVGINGRFALSLRRPGGQACMPTRSSRNISASPPPRAVGIRSPRSVMFWKGRKKARNVKAQFFAFELV